MNHALAPCLIVLAAALAPGVVLGQSLSEQVLEQVNLARWDNGNLPPLKGHAQLDASALLHSTNMGQRDFFMHCDPDTLTSHSGRMSAAGYSSVASAENIAAGNSTAAAVMAQWMNSSGHRANILSGNYHELGVGYYFDPGDGAPKRYTNIGGCTPNTTISGNFAHYWTQNFGRRGNHYPVVIAREAYLATVCDIDVYLYGSGFASEMRFSNDGGASWSAWQAFAANAIWTLNGNTGTTATVHAEIRSSGGSVRSASDTIRLGTTCNGISARVFRHGFEG